MALKESSNGQPHARPHGSNPAPIGSNEDVERLRWEIDSLLSRNSEEKQKLATFTKDANAAIETVIQKSREHILQLSTKYKEFLDENEAILKSASQTLAKYAVKPGESTIKSTTKDSVPCSAQEDESSTFISTELEPELEVGDSRSYKYQVELIDVIDRNHGPDEIIRRCFYKPHKSPPTAAKKKVRCVTSLLNPPTTLTQDINELPVRTISEYKDTDVSKKQFKYPYQLASGPKNELIVTDRECHQLIIFDEKLESSSVFGTRGSGKGTFYNPTGLAVDSAGSYLYVADHNNIIQKFKIEYDEGASSCQFQYVAQYGGKGRGPGQLQCPCGLAVTKSGSKLYVCDFRNHRIQVFSDNGEAFHVFGKHGKGNGEFDEPHSVAINTNEDKIFVSDHSNNRIQVFTSQGEFHQVIVDYTTSPNPQMKSLEASVILVKDSYWLIVHLLTAFWNLKKIQITASPTSPLLRALSNLVV